MPPPPPALPKSGLTLDEPSEVNRGTCRPLPSRSARYGEGADSILKAFADFNALLEKLTGRIGPPRHVVPS